MTTMSSKQRKNAGRTVERTIESNGIDKYHSDVLFERLPRFYLLIQLDEVSC